MTIADKLTSINNTKGAIKNAIEAKGVTVGSVPFADYPAKIAAIEGGGGGPVIPQWVRPEDWLTLPVVLENEQKIVILNAIYNSESNYISFVVTGDYTVDWGDGLIENFSSGIQANHTYNWGDIPSNTLTSDNFRQVLITITPQSGSNLLTFDSSVSHPSTPQVFGSGILEFVMSAPNGAGLRLGYPSTGNLQQNNNLQRVVIINEGISLTSLPDMFRLCPSLCVVDIPNTVTLNGTNTFNNTTSLLRVPSARYESFSRTFENTGAYEIGDIYYTADSHPDGTALFRDCSMIKTNPLIHWTFPIRHFTTGVEMFYGCRSLIKMTENFYEWFERKDTGTRNNQMSVVDMFRGCSSLEEGPYFFTGSASGGATAVLNYARMYFDCVNLKKVNHILYLVQSSSSSVSGTGCEATFSGCFSLIEAPDIIGNGGTFSLSRYTNMFANCRSLRKVGFFDMGTATGNAKQVMSMFLNCISLVEIPAFNMAGPTGSSTNIVTMVSGCRSLRRCPVVNIAANFSVAGTAMGAEALNELFGNLVTTTGRTVTITGTPGSATCDRSIATAKGWTVTG